MAIGHFIWTDLSTFDMDAARADYSTFFGWKFLGDDAYSFAQLKGQAVAAVFPMPAKLAEINLPSFWMSYVHVEDVDAIVASARNHDGVVIEVEPTAFNEDARIALIRDPSGAGFTVYEGPDITPARSGAGVVQARFHHVRDVNLIAKFYDDLFGWSFAQVADDPWPTFNILHPDGATIAQVEEVPEAIRGKFNYWMPSFSVESIDAFKQLLAANNGECFSDMPGNRAMVADQQGAHFMVCGRNSASSAADTDVNAPAVTTGVAWKALLGLVCVWLAVFLDVQAFWGILFLIWTWPAIKSGRADFVEPVDRQTRPVLYWSIIATWVFLSVWLIGVSLASLL